MKKSENLSLICQKNDSFFCCSFLQFCHCLSTFLCYFFTLIAANFFIIFSPENDHFLLFFIVKNPKKITLKNCKIGDKN